MICIHSSTHEYLRRSKLPSTTPSSSPSLLLILPCSLRLRRTPNSLRPILTLLACVTIPSALCLFPVFPKTTRKAIRTLLPARLLNLRRLPISHQPIMRLKLLHHLVRVVDQRETGALATAILCSEAEDGDRVFAGFVELGEFGPEFVFGDIGAVGVKDIPGSKIISKSSLSKDIR
jgi:hypothetical protein